MRGSWILPLVLMTTAVGAGSAEELNVRLGQLPQATPWVGQQVLVPVILSMSQHPRGSPRFRVPEVPGAVFLQVAGRSVYGSETRDGVTFTTWMYDFAFYSHRAGDHPVPPIEVVVDLPRGDGTWRQVRAKTERFSLRSKMPDEAKGLAALITTTELEASESWTPGTTEAKVGDAITRTVSLRAPNMLGMGFPPLRFPAPDDIGVYPKPPKVSGETYRGDVSGARTETVVYVFEKEGTFTLPGLTIPWFDPETQELKRVVLPERRMKVHANPAFVTEPELPVEEEHGRSSTVPLLGALSLILLVAAAMIINRLTRFSRRPAGTIRPGRTATECLPPLNPRPPGPARRGPRL